MIILLVVVATFGWSAVCGALLISQLAPAEQGGEWVVGG